MSEPWSGTRRRHALRRYLEYQRLVHPYSNEYFTPTPDARSTNVLLVRLSMTWLTTFQTPGDLDSRVKSPDDGVTALDAGQKTTILSDDFYFNGRWDIALGDPDAEFGKICNALGQ